MAAILVGLLCLFIAFFTFDITFNLRRLNNSSERIWRKLAEIADLLQKR
jgi:hypothetical protein